MWIHFSNIKGKFIFFESFFDENVCIWLIGLWAKKTGVINSAETALQSFKKNPSSAFIGLFFLSLTKLHEKNQRTVSQSEVKNKSRFSNGLNNEKK